MTGELERRELGRTGIMVSRLCFGTLTMGPLHARLSVSEGARLLRAAFDGGVNFVDSAELYRTYQYIREAVSGARREDVVIASRSYDYTYEGMRKTLEGALRSLGVEYIDVFGLHEQESAHTLRGHSEALRCLVDARHAGKVRAVAVSTHHVACVRAAAVMPEIDVIHPLVNMSGIGIADGSAREMIEAIRDARRAGKGIYAMKALGGGALLRDIERAFGFVLAEGAIDSIAVGVKTEEELRMDLAIFEGRPPRASVERGTLQGKRLVVEPWCVGCGQCAERCTHGAIVVSGGRARVDESRCVLCGYCQAACPEFCLKVV